MSAQPTRLPGFEPVPDPRPAEVIQFPTRHRLPMPDEWGSPITSRTVGKGSADMECVHGRLPGDVCPSPQVVFAARAGRPKRVVVQNWPHPHPCGCWPSEIKEGGR